MSKSLSRWLRQVRTGLNVGPVGKIKRKRVLLDLEALEVRAVPAVYIVTDFPDSNGSISGGSGTAQDPFQAPSLRSAIVAANATAGVADTIIVPAGTYMLTIKGSTNTQGTAGDLDITDDLTIQGAGAATTIIDASSFNGGSEPDPDRVMHIRPPQTLQVSPVVTLQGLTIQGGNAPTADPRGGGILNEGDLKIVGCIVQNNGIDNSSSGEAAGGGIYNRSGTLDIETSTVSNNHARGSSSFRGLGGGVYTYGGAVTIASSTVSDNLAYGSSGGEGGAFNGEGGGLFTVFGQVTIKSSTFSGNQADGGGFFRRGARGLGGGLYNENSQSLVIQDSTFSNNVATGGSGNQGGGDGEGGGIGIGGLTPSLTLSNSTISDNMAVGGNGFSGGEGGNAFGGGIYSDFSTSIKNDTIAFNQANGGTVSGGQAASVQVTLPTGFGQGGGYFDGISDPAVFESTLVAKNTVNGNEAARGPDVASFGTIQSNGHNLIGNGDGSNGGFSNPTDQVGTGQNPIDPLLGSLQNNGGPTSTRALLKGSPAINKGSNPDNLQFDQRGPNFFRVVGPAADVGAFEVQGGIVFTTFSSKVQFLGSNVTANGTTLLADTLFVNSLYQQLLNRAPDQSGVNNWVFLLQSGVPRSQVVTAIFASPEHRGFQVDALYLQILHRPADPTGRASFVNALLAGATQNDVARALLLSPEYQTANASDSAFINALYADVLGRSPAGGEAAGWTSALASGMTRAAVVQAFLTSPEYYARVVSQYYSTFLGRTPSVAEVQGWITFLQNNGGNLDLVAEMFLASAEYYANPK